ncbi:hypothetical protein [Adhaeribacter terreus]|uniref:Uncharacterized protein n=1 Tax=Adhaeribacter terreus TaxID=529703 RepID=A0ABW0E6U9_9BACT
MWTEIKSDADLEWLLKLYASFHDSCLRDLHISTKEFVDEERAMSFDNKNVATLLFQRQAKENPVLELKFEDVERFNFNPPEMYGGVIFEATFKKENDLYYWSDEDYWGIGDNEANWISAKKVFWRLRPELLGNISRLKPEELSC